MTAPELCHCGTPTVTHPDGFTRGLCRDCDAVRCDAYPHACVGFTNHPRGNPNVTTPPDDLAWVDAAERHMREAIALYRANVPLSDPHGPDVALLRCVYDLQEQTP